MKNNEQIEFLISVFTKSDIPITVVNPNEFKGINFSSFFWNSDELLDKLKNTKTKTVYRFTDKLFCSFIFLKLSDLRDDILLIGPFLQIDISSNNILEYLDSIDVKNYALTDLQSLYDSLNVLLNNSPLINVLDVFCENIWGKGIEYKKIDLNNELASPLSDYDKQKQLSSLYDEMKEMEKRYSYESELFEAVANGVISKANVIKSKFSFDYIERRNADPIRNMKNYLIIVNTLLRKAAEQGGVHPYYINQLSTTYAHKIESLFSLNDSIELVNDMIKNYCGLVREKSVSKYSPLIQNSILLIDENLSNNISLKDISKQLNINASYLSFLFRKETGKTISDYIVDKRIKLSTKLLITTNLQIKSIAQLCGIDDLSYFSRIFKKQTGKTPSQYRNLFFNQGNS